MNIITKRDVIKSAVKNFLHLYDNGYSEQYKEYYNAVRAGALRALDTATCTEQAVEELLNKSWTCLACDECGSPVEAVVQIGANEDYEDACGSAVCMSCMQAAVKKLQPTVVHIKTGNVYSVVGHAINATNEQSGQSMTAYERDGQMYVREAIEFSEKFIPQPQL